MKKLFTLSLAALTLVASLAFVAPQTAQAQGPGLISSILNKMDRNRRDLSSLRAALMMEKYNAQLHDGQVVYGDMVYLAAKGRDANVRVDWKKPAEILSVLNGQYTLYRPRLNQAIQGSARGGSKNTKVNGVLSFAFNMTGTQAKSQFNVDIEGNGELYPGSPHVWWLKLTPRGGASYQFAEVWVTDDGMPLQARVTEKNGDATTVRLSNVQRNARVSPSDIEIQLPAGTKIVKG